MDRLLLLIMAASGLSAASSAAGRQYYIVYGRKNFAEAQRYCREKYTDLVSVDTQKVVDLLKNTANLDHMVYTNNSYRAWIGLSGNSWRWSLSDPGFYRPGETDFRRWGSRQPDAGYSGKVCVLMNSRGDWDDYGCDNTAYSVCSDVRGSNVTFVVVTSGLTWTGAQNYCRAHHTDLASVRDMTDHQKIQGMLRQAVWIGLFRDPWKWSDGSSSSFSFWKTGAPDIKNGNQTCMAADFSQSGAWEGWPCDMERAFICYGPVVPVTKKVMKVKIKKKGNVDLSDPAVMAAMLEQLQQKLRDQGKDPNIKLSWRKQADGQVFHKEDQKTTKRRRKRDEL